MSEIIKKAWGTSELVFIDETHELRRIHIEKGGYCSLHKHSAKFNFFWIEEGKLELTIFTIDRDTEPRQHVERKIIIGDQLELQKYTVYPNVKHKFLALEETIAYELYFMRVNPDDIYRFAPFQNGGITSGL